MRHGRIMPTTDAGDTNVSSITRPCYGNVAALD